MPISEMDVPLVTALDGPTRCAELLAVIDYLDVEHSPRYLPGNGSTWCNVFSTDVAYLARAPLPHAWWVDAALARWAKGEDVPVRYGKTVTELSANGLHAWMLETGTKYDWQRAGVELAQSVVNAGGFGICLAAKVTGSKIGHVSVIRPEVPPFMALRSRTGEWIAPAQAQAGATNRAYQTTRWWDKPGYRGGLWVNAWTDPATLLKRAVSDVLG